ncbi:hypothetical protein [Pseudomonas sp. NFACC39-1]|uniref:hypothetical protein n=1 Tax=Pseudomonas sp. NFACC39-1 TaxID=1566195 RepID=UPI001160A9AA|nr:hypothetical protein [Pseudomonas sp. NFACC39-1]
MLKELIEDGMLPVQALKSLVVQKPSISNLDLAIFFTDEFPDVSGEARQVIWRWERPGKRQGIDDDKLNYLLLQLLVDASYISHAEFEKMVMRV